MSEKHIIICGLVMIVCLMLVQTPIELHQWHVSIQDELSNQYALAYDIAIACNEDWILQGWPGNGTYDMPFIVDERVENSIHISNSTSWFVIRNSRFRELIRFDEIANGRVEHSQFANLSINKSKNVSVFNNTPEDCLIILDTCTEIEITNNSIFGFYDTEHHGVDVLSSSNISISNNTIADRFIGINVKNSSNCSLEGNSISICGRLITVTTTIPPEAQLVNKGFIPTQSEFDISTGEAIRIENCTRTEIKKNLICDNLGGSLLVGASNETIIYDNEMLRNNKGMIIHNCNAFSIKSNRITLGITIQASRLGFVCDNTLFRGGLSLVGSLDQLLHSISNNSADALPIMYLASIQSSIIQSQVLYEIILVNCTKTIIQDVVIAGGTSGIDVLFSQNCIIERVSCPSFIFRGSQNTTLEDSIIDGSGNCIIIDTSIASHVDNNTSNLGIYVTNYSNDTTISNNTLHSITSSAIFVDSDSSGAMIESNDIRLCGRSFSYGFYTFYRNAIEVQGDNCTIINNIIVDNYGVGIYLLGQNSRVYYNIIARNGWGNAKDYGTNNTWDDGVSRGNIWGDYIGIGYYYIQGSAGSFDRYPALSLDYIEQSVFVTWGVLAGTPTLLIVLIGAIIFNKRRERAQSSKPVEFKRVGLG